MGAWRLHVLAGFGISGFKRLFVAVWIDAGELGELLQLCKKSGVRH